MAKNRPGNQGKLGEMVKSYKKTLEIGMLLIRERSPREEERRGHVPRVSLLPSSLPSSMPSSSGRAAQNPSKRNPLSLSPWRRVAIRLHRPTARRAAFASNAHQGVFFFFFYSSSFSSSSSSSFSDRPRSAHPFSPPLLFSLPRTTLKYSPFALLHSCGNS